MEKIFNYICKAAPIIFLFLILFCPYLHADAPTPTPIYVVSDGNDYIGNLMINASIVTTMPDCDCWTSPCGSSNWISDNSYGTVPYTGAKMTFIKTFTLPEGIYSADILMAADDEFDMSINGQMVAQCGNGSTTCYGNCYEFNASPIRGGQVNLVTHTYDIYGRYYGESYQISFQLMATPTGTPPTNTYTPTETPTMYTDTYTDTYTPSYTYTPTMSNTDTPVPTPTWTATEHENDDKCSNDSEGDPVSPYTGGEKLVINDFKFMGKMGFDFDFTRHYRSDLSWYTGVFGQWWTFTYDTSILIAGNGNLILVDTDGSQYNFILQTDGSYTGEPFLGYSMVKSGNNYILTKIKEHKTYTYTTAYDNNRAQLMQISDIYNNTITLTYNAAGRVSSIRDTAGRTINFAYNSIDKISAVSCGQATYNYTYNDAGLLSGVSGPGVGCSYTYDNNSRLYSKQENRAIDGYANVTYLYDSDGRVISETSPQGTLTFEYQMLNNGTYSDYSLSQTIPQSIRSMINAPQSPFLTIVHEYDGRIKNIYMGGTGNGEKITLNGITIKTAQTNPLNFQQESITDQTGNNVSGHYNSNAEVSQVTRNYTTSSTGGAAAGTTYYTYDSAGFITKSKDPEGRVVEYTRDSYENITAIQKGYDGALVTVATMSYPDPENPQNYTETTWINNSNDAVTKTHVWNYSTPSIITDTLTVSGIGVTKSFRTVYDMFGRVIRKDTMGGTEIREYTDYAGGGGTMKTYLQGESKYALYTYNTRQKITQATDKKGYIKYYNYYPDDKLQSEAINVTKPNSIQIGKSYTYYPAGGLNAGLLYTVSDGNKTTTYNYDNLGYVNGINLDGINTTYVNSFSNGVETQLVTDNGGESTTYIKSESGMLLEIDYANQTSVKFTYDKSNNRTQMIDQKLKITTYAFDGLNRMNWVQDDSQNVTEMWFDPSGNMISRSDQNLTRNTTFAYDLFNRVLNINAPDGTRTMTYDNNCSCGGKILSETIPGYGTINYTYNTDSMLSTTIYPDGTVIANSYDANNNQTDVILNGSEVTHTDYNEANMVYRVTDESTGTNEVFNISNYDAAGHKLEIDYPNNNKMEYAYGQGYKMQKADGYLGSDIMTKCEVTNFDSVGNIKTKSMSTGDITYNYDNIYQLTNYDNANAVANKQVAYNYDTAGNRSSVVADATINYTPNDLNEYTSVSGISTMGYDANGNMTQKGSKTLTWDYNNRLSGASIGSKTIAYNYNHNNLRVGKNVNGAVTHYYYNGKKLFAEGDGTKILKIYTSDDEGALGMTRKIYTSSGTFSHFQRLYYLFDNLGSVTALTDDTGRPVQYYQYDAYGQITNATGDPINSITFVGRYYGQKDWDTGFIYFWHRWYDAQLGRWISRDPVGVKGGVNLYGYVHNRPGYAVDTKGLDDQDSPTAPNSETTAQALNGPPDYTVPAAVIGCGIGICLTKTVPGYIVGAICILGGVALAISESSNPYTMINSNNEPEKGTAPGPGDTELQDSNQTGSSGGDSDE